jgi:hypothetical protein
MRRRLLILVLLSAALVGLALRPICVPLTADDLAGFNVPIEQRTDRDFYLAVFQHRDGRWYQCKTWISRALFF